MNKNKYVSAAAASQMLKNDESKEIFCKIKNLEYKVGFVNVNNKTFQAERKNSSRPYNFEDFEDIDNLFYKK